MLLVVAVLITSRGYSHDVEIDGIAYNLDAATKTASVTYKHSGDKYEGNVVIPASITSDEDSYAVTSIGVRAFSRCTGLTSIDIPSSVTNIGDEAFSRYTGLTSIDILSSVTSIGEHAFESCSGLTSINIPASVTSIGNFAFTQCTKLKIIYALALYPLLATITLLLKIIKLQRFMFPLKHWRLTRQLSRGANSKTYRALTQRG